MGRGYYTGRRNARHQMRRGARKQGGTEITAGMALLMLCALPIVLYALVMKEVGRRWGYGGMVGLGIATMVGVPCLFLLLPR